MQSLVPLKGGLFETIDGLLQMTNFVLHAFLDETFWLFEIRLLI